MLLRTLHVVFRLNAFKFKPAPVQDFVCEDGDQSGLEDWSTAIFVEIALFGVSDRIRQRWDAAVDVRVDCSWVSLSLVLLGVGRWIACDVGRWERDAWLARGVLLCEACRLLVLTMSEDVPVDCLCRRV